MCGIVGVAGRHAAHDVERSVAALRHRGPDDEGTYVDAAALVSLGHTRLAIQDPRPEGRQPFSDPSGQVTLVFNGEIYNFRELRRELQARGFLFRTNTDTEVLLDLYLCEGANALLRLDGIFAFAIWDRRSGELLIARDGMGVKPLYYSEEGGCVSFASEIKALIGFPWIGRAIDREAIASYLRFLWCPSPGTPLLGVRKVAPGEALLVRNGRIARRWSFHALPFFEAPAQRPVTEWAAAIRSALDMAVERQMVADVPVGAFLSGGLDSSLIVAMARRHTAKRLQCFTIDYDARLAAREGIERDLPYAERVARHLDVDLHVVRVGVEIFDQLDEMIWHLEEPQADFAALNVLHISRLARTHGVKVLLSGAGGDDLFSGYRRHRAVALEPLVPRLPALVAQSLCAASAVLPKSNPTLRRLAKLLSVVAMPPEQRLVSYFQWADTQTVTGLFARDGAPLPQAAALSLAVAKLPRSASPLQRMLLLEQSSFLVDHNLNYTDKASMAAGVEVRVPFLDPDLMRLAASIPDRLRQRGRQGKWILKRAAEPLLPRSVIYRPKTGFGVPLRGWVRGPLKDALGDMFARDSLARHALFDPDSVARMFSATQRGSADHSYTLLAIACIELWCRRFVDAPAREDARLVASLS